MKFIIIIAILAISAILAYVETKSESDMIQKGVEIKRVKKNDIWDDMF